MIILTLVVDQNIIKKHWNKPLQMWLKNVIHDILECGKSIGKDKKHHQKLIMAFIGLEGFILMIEARCIWIY